MRLKLFEKNFFLKDALTLTSGTTLGQLVVILSSPLLTRLYSPSEFGVLAVYTSLLNLVAVISSLRYELAIPLPEKDENAKNLFSISWQINLVFGLLILIISLILNDSITNWTNSKELKPYLWLLSVGIIFLGTYKALNYWAIRKNEYNKLARTKFFQSSASVFTQVISGLTGFGAFGLILGQIIGQSAGITSLARKSNLMKYAVQFRKNISEKTSLLKEYKNFPLYDSPASLLNVLSLEMPQLLFASLFNPSIAGFYLLSQKVLGIPLRIIGQSISQVLYGNINQHIKNRSLSRITLKIILILTGITIIPLFLLLFFGPDLFSMIFGQEWYEAGRFASILIIIISFQFVYSPISLILLATNGQKINFIFQIIMVSLKFVAIYIGWKLNDPYLAVLGISIVGSLVYLIGIFVIYNRTVRLNEDATKAL